MELRQTFGLRLCNRLPNGETGLGLVKRWTRKKCKDISGKERGKWQSLDTKTINISTTVNMRHYYNKNKKMGEGER